MDINIKKYSQIDGLNSYNVRKILTDKYGLLWIATQDGLNRFDSRIFINTAFSENIVARTDIRDLYYDNSGNFIWALGGEGKLFKIDAATGKLKREYLIPKKFDDDWNICFSIVGEQIWIGCLSGIKLFNTSTEKFIMHPIKGINQTINMGDNEVRSLLLDDRRNLWIFSSHLEAQIIDPITLKEITHLRFGDSKRLSKKNHCRVWSACFQGKNLFIATDNGIFKLNAANYSHIICTKPNGIKNENLLKPSYAITNYRENQFLVSGDGLCIIDSNLQISQFIHNRNFENRDWIDNVRSITVTNDGYVWLGCTLGLMYFSKSPSPFFAIRSLSNNTRLINHVYSMFGRDTVLYVNADDHLFTYVHDHLNEIDSGKSLQNLFEGPGGEIWISSQSGTLRLADGKLNELSSKYRNSSISAGRYNSSVFFNDTLLIATDNYQGLISLKMENSFASKVDLKSTPGIYSNVVKTVYKDHFGGIWVLSNNVVSYKKPGNKNFQRLSFADGKLIEYWMYFDMCEAAGSYWMAVHHVGIVEIDRQFRVKAKYTTKEGLANSGVYKIFPIGDTALFITTNNGLSVLDIKSKKIKNFYESDGLHGNAFEESCGIIKNGLIYAGGINGFTIIDPSKFTTNTIPPKTYINRVLIERADNAAKIDTTNIELKQLEVPSDALQVSLYFSGINYSNADRTTFAYRIKEHDKNWVNIGTQNYINLIGLPPGTYQLEVRAANEDNVWSKPVALTLVYLPKWYQTWTFKIALVLLALGLGYLGYRIRISQILKQQKIRRDVASDLHDDIGSSLNSVKVFAHLAKANPAEQDYIANIEDNLEQATVGLRDMIWVLDDNRDSVADLCSRLSQYAAKPAEAIGIEVHMITDGVGDMILPKTAKRNLFLIAKECINNCVKYAGCTNIWLTVRLQSKKLVFIVKDDGCGFDEGKITEGYGLNNIRNRAEQIGFTCTIVSGTTGTEITIAEK